MCSSGLTVGWKHYGIHYTLWFYEVKLVESVKDSCVEQHTQVWQRLCCVSVRRLPQGYTHFPGPGTRSSVCWSVFLYCCPSPPANQVNNDNTKTKYKYFKIKKWTDIFSDNWTISCLQTYHLTLSGPQQGFSGFTEHHYKTNTQILRLGWCNQSHRASLQDQYTNFTVRLMQSKSPSITTRPIHEFYG